MPFSSRFIGRRRPSPNTEPRCQHRIRSELGLRFVMVLSHAEASHLDAPLRSQSGLDFRRCMSDALNRQIEMHPLSGAAHWAAFGVLGHVFLQRRPDTESGLQPACRNRNRLARLIFNGAITRPARPSGTEPLRDAHQIVQFYRSHGAVLELVLWLGA